MDGVGDDGEEVMVVAEQDVNKVFDKVFERGHMIINGQTNTRMQANSLFF